MTLSVTHSIKQSDGGDHDEFLIDHRPVDHGQTASQHRGDAAPRTDSTQHVVIIGG